VPIPLYDRATGERCGEAELFVAVLGASSYVYAEALPSQELIHWTSAHVHAFEDFGGCTRIVVCDNLKSGVTRPHRYEPDVNATYQGNDPRRIHGLVHRGRFVGLQRSL
jgi:transposase